MRNVDDVKGSLYTIEEKPVNTKKFSFTISTTAISVSVLAVTAVAAAWWVHNHVTGGCLGVQDWFAYCSAIITH